MDRKAELRTGLLASLLYNPNRKKGAKALRPEDFFPAPGARQKAPVKRRRRKVGPRGED